MATKKSSKKQTSSTEKRPARRKKIMSLAEYEADRKTCEPSAPTTAPVGAGAKGPVEPAPKKRVAFQRRTWHIFPLA